MTAYSGIAASRATDDRGWTKLLVSGRPRLAIVLAAVNWQARSSSGKNQKFFPPDCARALKKSQAQKSKG